MDPSELSFDNYWTLISPSHDFDNRYDAAKAEWEAHPEKQEPIIRWLKKHGAYPGRNPYFFIQDWQVKPPRRQVLSFKEYYARYNTTEERDGWKRVHLENEQKTIYVKN